MIYNIYYIIYMNSVIEKFLREGNNVNKFSRIFAEQQAPMPLIYPIIKMNPEGVKLLLDADADPNIKVGAFFRGPTGKDDGGYEGDTGGPMYKKYMSHFDTLVQSGQGKTKKKPKKRSSKRGGKRSKSKKRNNKK